MSGAAVSLAELLAALSLATDLGTGLPLETALRTCRVAAYLATRQGYVGDDLAAAYYGGLLRHLGCTAWAYEAAALVGDDHDVIRTFEDVDEASRTAVARRALRTLARSAPPVRRARAVATALSRPGAPRQLARAQCDQARVFASDLGLGEHVSSALGQIYERPDGRGPLGLRKDAIVPGARVVHAAQIIEALHRKHGRDTVLAELRQRRGRQLDLAVCDSALTDTDAIWAILETPSAFEAVIESEPAPRVRIVADQLSRVALAFARFADLKVPSKIGHSPEVARIARAAGELGGVPVDEAERLHLAGLLHDLGSVSVGNDVWDLRGPLGAAAWERVRLHAYHGERILLRCSATAPIAELVGAHHERLDGSGYHRGSRAAQLGRSARILAAADAYVAMGEARPHRPARPDPAAELRAEAGAGRLCRDAVELVLEAAGHTRARLALPAGLTEREAEVLGLVARGMVTKEIATELDIAVRTVKHHIEHIYEKTGVNTRAGAALFAARHDLVVFE